MSSSGWRESFSIHARISAAGSADGIDSRSWTEGSTCSNRAFCAAIARGSSTIFDAFDSRAIQKSGVSCFACTPMTACAGIAEFGDGLVHAASSADARNATIDTLPGLHCICIAPRVSQNSLFLAMQMQE